MRIFVEIKSSRNGEITLSISDIGKSYIITKIFNANLSFNSISKNKILAKISGSAVFSETFLTSWLQYVDWSGPFFGSIYSASHFLTSCMKQSDLIPYCLKEHEQTMLQKWWMAGKRSTILSQNCQMSIDELKINQWFRRHYNGGCSSSVVECLTRDRRAAGSSLTRVTALWSLSKTHLS